MNSDRENQNSNTKIRPEKNKLNSAESTQKTNFSRLE